MVCRYTAHGQTGPVIVRFVGQKLAGVMVANGAVRGRDSPQHINAIYGDKIVTVWVFVELRRV